MNIRRFTTLAALIVSLCLFGSSANAQVPQLINYQGRVAVSGTNFTGTGQFKFALVSGSTPIVTYWSNDGTSSAGSEPQKGVSLNVDKGLYSILLGDATLTNMTAIFSEVFINEDVRLRVWFNNGTHGWQQLTPDPRIAAVGYAMMANKARTADSAAVADAATSATYSSFLRDATLGTNYTASDFVKPSDLAGLGEGLTWTTAVSGSALSLAQAALPTSGGALSGTLTFTNSGVIVGPLADSVGGGTAKLSLATNTASASPLKLYSNAAVMAYNAQTATTGSTALIPHESLLAVYAATWDSAVRGIYADMAAAFNYSSVSIQNTYLVGYHSVATNRGSGVVAGVVGFETHIGNQTTTVGQAMPFAKQYIANSPICYPDAPITTSTGLEIEAQKIANVTTGYGINQLGASDVNIFNGTVRLPNATLNLTDRTTVPSVSNVQDLFLRRRIVDTASALAAEFTYTKTGSGNAQGGGM